MQTGAGYSALGECLLHGLCCAVYHKFPLNPGSCVYKCPSQLDYLVAYPTGRLRYPKIRRERDGRKKEGREIETKRKSMGVPP